MTEKSSFVLYDRYAEQINMLNDEQAGQLFKAIYAYRWDKEMEIADPIVAILWSVIRQQLNNDEQKYQEVCNKRKSAGQKGGRPVKLMNAIEEKQQEEEAKANGFLAFEKNPDNDIEDDIDNDNEKNNTPLLSPQGERKAKPIRHRYGQYNNVLLSDGDVIKLQGEYLDWQERIERLSEYMASTGKTYKNHLATIRSWAHKDKAREPTPVNNADRKKPDDGLDALLTQMYQRGWE